MDDTACPVIIFAGHAHNISGIMGVLVHGIASTPSNFPAISAGWSDKPYQPLKTAANGD